MAQQILRFDQPSTGGRFKRDPSWFFENGNRVDAMEALRTYSTRYSGTWFERFADSGKPNRFTAQDIIAVSMLGVEIPAGTTIWLLNDGAEQVQALLKQLPTEQKLWDDDIDVSPQGPLWGLWTLIRSGGWPNGGGMGRTKTSKLMATKRPHSVPIYDSLVADALFTGEASNYWDLWRERLTGTDGVALRALVNDVREESGVGEDLSLLRVIDVVVWMWEKDRRRGNH